MGDPSQAPVNASSHISSYDIVCHAVGLPIVTLIVLLRLWAKRFVIGQIHIEDCMSPDGAELFSEMLTWCRHVHCSLCTGPGWSSIRDKR